MTQSTERPSYAKGDIVVSPDSNGGPWRPLRVTVAHHTPNGYCLVRIASLSSAWIRAEALLPAPKGATYDTRASRWFREGADVTPRRADLPANRSDFGGESE